MVMDKGGYFYPSSLQPVLEIVVERGAWVPRYRTCPVKISYIAILKELRLLLLLRTQPVLESKYRNEKVHLVPSAEMTWRTISNINDDN